MGNEEPQPIPPEAVEEWRSLAKEVRGSDLTSERRLEISIRAGELAADYPMIIYIDNDTE